MTTSTLSPELNGEPAATRFLTIGECMVEMAPTQASMEYRMGFAGDVFNTAWYLKALRPDVDVSFYSRVGTDATSDAMLEKMVSGGIDISKVGRDAERSVGLYLIALKDGERSFSYWRSTSAARQMAASAADLSAACDSSDVIYFSGITLAVLEGAGRETLLEALGHARAAGKTIAFDPNLRPRLWTSNDEMVDWVMKAGAVSDLVLPSFEDEADHFGDADLAATRDRYANVGATTVIVKNGAESMLYLHDGETGEATPVKADSVVDSTAAGDSFNAGFFAQLDMGRSMEEMILNSASVAKCVIGKKGALVPLDLDLLDTHFAG